MDPTTATAIATAMWRSCCSSSSLGWLQGQAPLPWQQQQQQQQQQFEQLQQQQLQIEQQQQKQQQLDQQQQMHAYAEYYANYYAAQYGGPEHFNYFYTMCIQQYLQHSQQQQPQQPLQQSGGGAADAGPVALPAGHQGGDLPVAAAHAAGQQCLQQQAAASVPARDAGSDSNSEAFALYSNIASANATSLVTSSTLPMGLPGATQPALPALYHQGGGNLYSKQYQMAHATGALSELPISDQAARVCPNGRPPHPFVSFGFGGRVLVVQSRSAVPAADGQSVGVASPNMLTLTTFPKLHAALVSHACDHASPSQHTQPNSHPHVGASGLLSNSILGVVRSRQPRQRDSSGEDPMLRVMADFPGPLGPSTSKDAVLKFIHERIAAFALEDPHASQGPEEVGRMMWQALAIMVKHEGLLKHAQLKKPGVKTGSPTAEQELIQMVNSQALACPPPSSSPNLASTTAMSAGLIGSGSVAPLMGPPQDDLRQQAAAEEVQRLVVQGRQQEAINVAIQAQLWGIALLIAKSCGEVASSGVITSMAYSCLVPGTPLRTMALMLAGKAEQAISPHHHGVQEGTLAPGMRDGQGVLLSTWRDNLAVMVGAARTPADVDAIVCLGDKLQAEGAQVLAAQLCYLVAGLRPSPFDLLLASRGQPAPSSSSTQGCAMRYCLLGVDHFSAPRTFAHVLAIQRTEILEWACGLVASGSRPASVPKHSSSASAQDLSAAGPGALPPLLPYKLVHAQLLTEYGRVQDALAYCQALDVHLRASGQGGCIPLLVKELESFKDRLLNFASAHSINVSRSESSITKIGRFLDGKLNKLLWGAHEQGASTGPVNKSQDLGPPKSAVVAFAGPDAPVVSLQIPSRGSTPGPVQAQGAGPHPVMSRVPSSQGLHAASSPPSHFSSAGESQMLRLHSQDLNVLPCPHKGTSLSSSRDALPSLLHNVSSTTTLGSTNDFCTPPGHSRQASGDASPWQTQVPQEAAKRLLLHQRGLMNAQQDGSLMARSSSSPGLDQHLQENNSSSQGGVPESAMPSGLPPLPPKSEERKAKSQVPTPGKSWGLMGLLTAGSKRMGSVVAQGKDAVAHAKGAAQEDKQLSTGAEKSQGFYYDKARGRWVIEGEEEPAEPPPPPPPPPTVLGQQPGGSPGCSKPNEATSPPLGPQMPVSVAAVLPNLQRGKGMRSRYVDPLFSGSTPSAEQAPPSSLLPVPPPGNSPIAPPSTFYVPSAPTNLTEGIAEGSSASNDHPNIVNACEHRNEMAPNEHLPPSVGTPAFGPLEAAFSGQNDSQDFKDVAF
mmetsp:Transcript_17890/g.46817  ORF Transcript_17890/g.46817 Transcript_17890/m.46817 type:complete len:1287 (+) Transcript_17890:1468-5328(+)